MFSVIVLSLLFCCTSLLSLPLPPPPPNSSSASTFFPSLPIAFCFFPTLPFFQPSSFLHSFSLSSSLFYTLPSTLISPHFISSLCHYLLLLSPPSLSLSLSSTSLSLSSLFSDLLTRFEQTRELLEKRKVFLLKIIASAYLPPPTPEQAPSSTKMVSNDGCAK